MSKVITFGEIMLRLQPESYQRFMQADSFGAVYGGSEANVSLSLACFGADTSYVTKLPNHELGQAAVNSLRRFGVDTTRIVRGGTRLGLYFHEKGASQRGSKVIYDRAGSAFALSSAADYDWNDIFADADWFHFTGITPALGGELPVICLQACRAAKKKGITVSFDPNYRKNLWTEEEARPVLSELMQYVDVIISNETQARELFGLDCKETGDRTLDCRNAAKELFNTFPSKLVALTIRTTVSSEENLFRAMLFTGKEEASSAEYDLHIIDRVGGGDAFAAGLIYALRGKRSLQETVEFATAAAALKHSVEGDANLVTREEVEKLSSGLFTARVSR